MNKRIDPNTLGDLESQVVTIKRVTKVVKGGKNMKFTALVVVGDRNGHVGYGLGKSQEIPEAIRKGEDEAKKNLIEVPRNDVNSIPYSTIGQMGKARVLLMNAVDGTGIIAGGPVRAVLELAGIQNIRTKSISSNNKNNVVAATVEGLKGLSSPEEIARRRGKTVAEILE